MASKSKYKKAKLKIHPITIITVGLILATIIVAIVLTVPSKGEKLARDFQNGSARIGIAQTVELSSDNHLKKVSINSAINSIKKGGTVVLLIGSFDSNFTVTNVGVFDSHFDKSVKASDKDGPKISNYTDCILFVNYKKIEDGINAVNQLKDTFGLDIEVNEDDPAIIMTFVNGALAVDSNDVVESTRAIVARETFKKTIAIIEK